MCRPASILLVALLLFLPGRPAAAQGEAPFRSFDHLTTSDGMVGGPVQALLEDRQGFMWFGSQQGLARYDGYGFRRYGSGAAPDALSEANVRALWEDEAGTLWIATWGGGLNRLDGETGALSHHRPSGGEPQRADYDFVQTLTSDGAGALWLATRGGLVHFDPASGDFRLLARDEVVALAEAPGQAWVVERGSLVAYSREGEQLSRRPLPAEASDAQALLRDSADRLWLGSEAGLWRVEARTVRRVEAIPEGVAVFSLLEGADGTLWVGTGGAGLYRLDGEGRLVEQFVHDPDDEKSIASDQVVGLHEGRTGILWAGSWTEGVSFLVPRAFPRHLPFALPLAFAPAADGTTWVGTFDAGLWRIAPDGAVLEEHAHDEAEPTSVADDILFALLPDDGGGLWTGTLNGLDYLPPGESRFRHFRYDPADPDSLSHDRVRALLRDRAGALWVGTAHGLNRYEPASGAFSRHRLVSADGRATLDSILALHEDGVGRLWVGGEAGLARIDPASGQTRLFTTANSEICHNFVTGIHAGENGTLWLGTWGGGLMHFDPATERWRCFTQDDGLVDNVLLAMADDGAGRLWLSTPQGLARFDSESERFERFTTADGLPHNDFVQGAALRQPDGTLWFGNTRGIVRFRPGEIGSNERPPPVALTGFYLSNQLVTPGPGGPLRQPIEQTSEIALGPGQNSVAFEYVALNYLNPSENQYAYRLRGFDDDWVEAGTRRLATFTNLDPGSYTFEVIASNNDGVWNREGAAIALRIAAPWWQQPWAFAAYGAAMLLLLVGAVELRTRVHRRALERERRRRERLVLIDHMKEAERERIARELHDGLAQTLASLRFRAMVWKTMLAERPKEELAAELDELGAILNESIEEVRRSVFALRPARLEETGLVPALEEAARTVARQYQLPVYSDLPPEAPLLDAGLELNLFRIASELLSNAAAHAGASAIWLTFRVEGDRLRLAVRDDGHGFDTARMAEFAATGHFGLRSMQERVTLMGGRFMIESAPGQGAHARVVVPMTKET